MNPPPRVLKKRNPHRHVYYGGKCLCGAVRKPRVVWIAAYGDELDPHAYHTRRDCILSVPCSGWDWKPTKFIEAKVTR